jgi:hypothetical protein
MKHLKTYEDIYSDENIELTKKYKDKFFITPAYMKEYSLVKKDFYITLVKNIHIKNNPEPRYDSKQQLKPHTYYPIADSFTVMKNGEIKNPGGWGMDYTEEEFNEIDFMTAQEFYNKDSNLVEKLYSFVIETLDSGKYVDWYYKMLKEYRRVLETIKDLEHFADAKKYNL